MTVGFKPWGASDRMWGATKKRSPVFGWSPGIKPIDDIGIGEVQAKASRRSASGRSHKAVACPDIPCASPRYLDRQRAGVGSIGAYKPLGGKNGTSTPGCQYWPHPPDGGSWHGEMSNNMRSYRIEERIQKLLGHTTESYTSTGHGKNSGFCINRSEPEWSGGMDSDCTNVMQKSITSSSYQPPKYKIFSRSI